MTEQVPSWLQGFLRMELQRGAIASVALSHEPDCGCDVCAASHGDHDAFVRVIDSLGTAR